MSSKFCTPLDLPVGVDTARRFEHVDELIRTAKAEAQAWAPLKELRHLSEPYQSQATFQGSIFVQLLDAAKNFKADQPDQTSSDSDRGKHQFQHFGALVQRMQDHTVLWSDTPDGARVVRLLASDPEAAAGLLVVLAPGSGRIPRDSPLRTLRPALRGVLAAQDGHEERAEVLERACLRAEDASSELDRHSKTARVLISTLVDEVSKQTQHFQESRDKLTREQEALTLGMKSDWSELYRFYHEHLRMEGPSAYWGRRQRTQRLLAIGYAATFLCVLLGALVLFALLGMPWLAALSDTDTGVVLVKLFVLGVPAFAVIWILRILGRLMATSLALADEANERQTMLWTFLAMARPSGSDESTADLVTNEDRVLILHALFRPSSGSTADDAPPVNWFDLLMNRMKGK